MDPSSNEVTFFNISNLFYGIRIHPGTLEIVDWALSGSSSAMTITLKDDGFGNIYRADCFTSASTWNNVGNVFYDEGVIVIKNPSLNFFGQEQFEMTFRGEQNVHTMKFDVVAPTAMLNSSSNPNFQSLSASGYLNDTDPSFVYITNITLHDANLNVIAKSQLAQPIMKRHNDAILFKIRFDV
jgi:hypothetical protein